MKKIVFIIFFVFVLVSVSKAEILNGSFESGSDGYMPNGVYTIYPNWKMPDFWDWRNSGATNGHTRLINSPDGPGWSSDGYWSLYMFASTGGSHLPGDYLEFYQEADLTDMTAITFDAYLKGGLHTNSYIAIDSDKLWVTNIAGEYFEESIDISSYTGIHEIVLGVAVFEAFPSDADGWTFYDNISLVPEPATLMFFALGGLMVRRKRS